MLAAQAVERLADQTASFNEIKRDLASLRDAAKAIGDRALAKAIASGIGWRAEVAANHPTDIAPLRALMDMAEQEVEPFSEWIIEE